MNALKKFISTIHTSLNITTRITIYYKDGSRNTLIIDKHGNIIKGTLMDHGGILKFFIERYLNGYIIEMQMYKCPILRDIDYIISLKD
jgi:hypothetical protein